MPSHDYAKIARELASIADLNKSLQDVGLTNDAIVVLLKDRTGLSKSTLNLVIKEIGHLAIWALAKKPPPKT